MRFEPGLARARTFSTPDEFALAVSGLDFDLAVLGRASRDWRIAEVDLGQIRLVRGQFGASSCVTGMVHPNVVSFTVPLPGNPWTLSGVPDRASRVAILTPGSEYTFHSPRATCWAAFRVESDFFARAFESALGRPLPDTSMQMITGDSRNQRALGRLHARAMQLFQRSPQALRDEGTRARIQARIVAALIATAAQATPARRRPLSAVGELRRLLAGCPDRPLELTEICERLGATPRSVRRIFTALMGASPARYLRIRRLHQARRALEASGGQRSVTDVAVALGFSDLGRFAQDYRILFGELPSITLRRARGRQP